MSRQRTRDTRLEIEVRRLLYAKGFRFRKHYPLPGLPRRSIDIAFPKRRIAIFLDGCYWHGCEIHRPLPKSNRDSWRAKIDENRARDADTNARLSASHWRVLRYWEHSKASEIVNDVLGHLSTDDARSADFKRGV